MSPSEAHTPAEGPPAWAIERAAAERDDTQDQATVNDRAWQIVNEAAEREHERHDEYDDPDQGGEG